MRVLAYDVIPIQTKLPVAQVPLDDLLAQSDVFSLHVPKTKAPILARPNSRK